MENLRIETKEVEDVKLEIVTCEREIEEKDKVISELKTELQEDNSDSTENIEKRRKISQDNKNKVKSWKGSETKWYTEDRQRTSNTQIFEEKADQWNKTSFKNCNPRILSRKKKKKMRICILKNFTCTGESLLRMLEV